MINRRNTIATLTSGAIATSLGFRSTANAFNEDKNQGDLQQTTSAEAASEHPSSTAQRIDSNVTLFKWPFRKLPLDQTDKLESKLRAIGIERAWAGSFEGVFQRDIEGVNQRLVDECANHPFFLPVGSINLSQPSWKQDLQRCIVQHQMHAIRLHPTYHQYSFDSWSFRELLKIAKENKLLIQIATTLEDTRTQNQLTARADANLEQLSETLTSNPHSFIQLLNYRPTEKTTKILAEHEGLYFDTARVDGTDGLKQMLHHVPEERLLFGTHAPFLIPEASMIRILESGIHTQAAAKILYRNAAHLSSHMTKP